MILVGLGRGFLDMKITRTKEKDKSSRRSNQSNLKETSLNIHGRVDAEAEVPVLWLPDTNSQLIGKDLDAGKD